jgi:two-component system LytT family response regulator
MTTPAKSSMIRAVIVDDEQPARRQMSERLSAHPQIVIVGEADRVKSAADLIGKAKPDAIFLDVQMPAGTGFALLPLLGDLDPPPAVVFVTAYDTYALKAFEANALDYLTKPVKASRLALTIDRLQKRLLPAGATPPDETAQAPAAGPLELRDLVLLREKNSMRMVEAGEICAVETEADYTRIHLAGGHTVLMRKRMAQWEQELPAPPFLKISRRLLLNMPRIKGIVAHDRESAEVRFEGTEQTVTVSRMELRRIRQAPE